MARYWFVYNAGINNDETSPMNYMKLNNSPEIGCSIGQNLCAIYVHDNGAGKPVASEISPVSSIWLYIAESRFYSGIPSPHYDPISNPPKPFVYMKS